MKILKNILIVIAALFVIAFMLPKTSKLERSIVIHAPADSIFAQINSFQNWVNWNPWQNKDTTMRISYYGPVAGVGATQQFKGESGYGKLSIVESVPNSYIIFTLQFEDMTPQNGVYNLEDEGNGNTRLIFSMDISAGNNPVLRYMNFIMKWMMQKDFETALANIKLITEQK